MLTHSVLALLSVAMLASCGAVSAGSVKDSNDMAPSENLETSIEGEAAKAMIKVLRDSGVEGTSLGFQSTEYRLAVVNCRSAMMEIVAPGGGGFAQHELADCSLYASPVQSFTTTSENAKALTAALRSAGVNGVAVNGEPGTTIFELDDLRCNVGILEAVGGGGPNDPPFTSVDRQSRKQRLLAACRRSRHGAVRLRVGGPPGRRHPDNAEGERRAEGGARGRGRVRPCGGRPGRTSRRAGRSPARTSAPRARARVRSGSRGTSGAVLPAKTSREPPSRSTR